MSWLLAALAACGPGLEISGVEISPSPDMPTVLLASWTTSEPVASTASYGIDGELSVTTDVGTAHSAVLWGLPGNAEVKIDLGAEGEDPVHSEMVTTGTLSNALPSIAVEGGSAEAWMTTTVLGGTTGPLVLSPAGKPVWFMEDGRDLDVYRARIAQDGEHILYNAGSISGEPEPDSAIVRVSLDGSVVETIPVPYLAHDFVELPDGRLAAIAAEIREVDGEEIRGDEIVEIDPETGEVTTVWSAWDCFDPAVHSSDDIGDEGWTFANALDYDADDDAYLLGIRNFSTIVKIDRATGTCLWALGGVGADIERETGTPPFLHQHQFELLDGGILIFDNDGAAGSSSRALEYSFDGEGGSVSHVWSHEASPTVYSFVLGDVHRQSSGDTLITWSAVGRIDRVNNAGEVSFSAGTELGYVFGFNTITDSIRP